MPLTIERQSVEERWCLRTDGDHVPRPLEAWEQPKRESGVFYIFAAGGCGPYNETSWRWHFVDALRKCAITAQFPEINEVVKIVVIDPCARGAFMDEKRDECLALQAGSANPRSPKELLLDAQVAARAMAHAYVFAFDELMRPETHLEMSMARLEYKPSVHVRLAAHCAPLSADAPLPNNTYALTVGTPPGEQAPRALAIGLLESCNNAGWLAVDAEALAREQAVLDDASPRKPYACGAWLGDGYDVEVYSPFPRYITATPLSDALESLSSGSHFVIGCVLQPNRLEHGKVTTVLSVLAKCRELGVALHAIVAIHPKTSRALVSRDYIARAFQMPNAVSGECVEFIDNRPDDDCYEELAREAMIRARA